MLGVKIWKEDSDAPNAPFPDINTPRPKGKRPPDGIIWAHNPTDFYRVMFSNKLWSRSMIEEFGYKLVNLRTRASTTPELPPCRLDPWMPPNLYLSNDCGDSTASDGMDGAVTKTPLLLSEIDSVEDQTSKAGSAVKHCFQQHIPKEQLPEYIMINDPHAKMSGHWMTDSVKPPKKYKRVYPKLEAVMNGHLDGTSSSPPLGVSGNPEPISRIAKMDLEPEYLGTGSHGSVTRATIHFPGFACPVSVAVKIPIASHSDLFMLKQEAEIYSSFSQHLSEDWSGYHYIEEALYDGDGIVPVKAIVPKFYGYYAPVMDEHDTLGVQPSWSPRPILILEDCGKPICTRSLTNDQRKECYSMVFRLHAAGYTQNSFFCRNVLTQPGPLTEPPHNRSKDTPSFRIIDFGRCVRKADSKLGRSYDPRIEDWETLVGDEIKNAQDTIYGEMVYTMLGNGRVSFGRVP